MWMVAKAERYFAPPFQGYRGLTQGNPLPPPVFGVLVDAVIRHWIMVVVPAEAGTEGLRETFQELTLFFYADDGSVASPQTERLHRAFNILTELFGQVGLCTNVWKMVNMD